MKQAAVDTSMDSTPQSEDEIEAYRQSINEVLARLEADAQNGLSRQEAAEGLRRYGANELAAEKPMPEWRKFLDQFKNVLVILLLTATAISAALWFYGGEATLPYEALAIFAVVVFNALMGYIQQSRAEKALAALHQMSAAHANVVRSGARQSILARQVVPGDIVLLGEGDTIRADARLIEATSLQTAEAALTGESLPVRKAIAAIPAEVGLAVWRGVL